MDEAFDLAYYLPVSFKAPDEQEYISFLWAAFEENYNNAKYPFAFLALHMLMMSFVYFNIWQLRKTRPDDFEKGLIGFSNAHEKILLKATSPFAFSVVGESSILRLLRLMGCQDSKIGEYAKLVKDRNRAAHPNGDIFLKTEGEAERQIRDVLRAVREIQTQSLPVIKSCYEEFLLLSYDPDVREYPDTEDQIREALVHDNYLSLRDIECCLNCDISALAYDNSEAIQVLHGTLGGLYGLT